MCRHWWLVPSAHRERQIETYRLVNTNLLCVMWRNQATSWPSLSVFVQSKNKHFSNLSQHCTRKRKLQLILSEYFSECILVSLTIRWLKAQSHKNLKAWTFGLRSNQSSGIAHGHNANVLNASVRSRARVFWLIFDRYSRPKHEAQVVTASPRLLQHLFFL